MNVSLTPEMEEMVNQKVESGLYNSASEVIREGLRLLKEQDDLRLIRQEELRREVMKGYEQSRSGDSRPLDAEAVKAKGRERLAARKRRAS
jgi:antitoxin ParD1/3/4